MSEVLNRLRAKYPVYAHVPDDKLTLAIGDKYPVYLQRDPDLNFRYQVLTQSQPPRSGEERAARDLQGLQSIGMQPDGQFGDFNRDIVAPLGKGFNVAGKLLYAGLQDVLLDVTGQTLTEREDAARGHWVYDKTWEGLSQDQIGERMARGEMPKHEWVPEEENPPRNVEAVIAGEEMPAVYQMRTRPAAEQVVAGAGRGLVETAPQMAGVAAATYAGVPPWVSAPVIFGTTEHGFDVEQAAIAAALPFVGRYSGELTGLLAKKLGVTTVQAANIWKGLGGTFGAAGILAALQAPEIMSLPPEQRRQALLDAVANVAGQMAMGPVGVKFDKIPPGEAAGRYILEQVRRAQSGGIEEAAAQGGEPAMQEVTPRETQFFTPGTAAAQLARDREVHEAKPPIEPKPPIQRLPGNKFRPVVPETPAEEYQTVLEEIRSANARTTRQVQELFPKRELTREEAAELRRLAWAESKAEPTPPPVAESDETSAEEPAKPSEPAAPEPTPASPPKVVPPLERGSMFTVSTPVENKPVTGQWGVANAFELSTSQDLGFDPSLQPRDRSRAASQQQIARIVTDLAPERLAHSHTSDLGAPLVDESLQVLSGNGRTMALRQVYQAGLGETYRNWLLQNAQDFGLSPQQIKKVKNPVLVRQVQDYGELSKQEFARQSNQQQVLGMSEAEKAAADARLLMTRKGLLEKFMPGEEGNVLAATNRDFLNEFIAATGDQAELLRKEGYNGPVLQKRVRNAVLGAYIGFEDRALINQLFESADELGLKRAAGAVMEMSPALFKFKGTGYDVAGLLHQALKDLVSIRTTGEKLQDFLDNKPLFADPGRTAESDILLEALYNAKSARAIAEGLEAYRQSADKALQESREGGMFGQAPTRERLLKDIYGRGPDNGQTDLPMGEPPAPQGGGGQTPKPPGPTIAAGNGGVPKPGGGGSIEPGPQRPTVLTDDKAAAARKRLLDKLGRTNIGVDPTILADVVIVAGNKIESGIIKYGDYVKAMVEDLGEAFRPYFKVAYNQVRDFTELHGLKNQLTSREEVEKYEQAAAPKQSSTDAAGVRATGAAGGQPQLPGAVRGTGFSQRPGIRVVDEGDLPRPRSIVASQQYTGPRGDAIDETQRLANNLALTRFEDGGEGFLLGDGTGVGKTGTQLVIAAEVRKRTKLPSLIVTQNRSIIDNRFKVDAEKFGVPLEGIEFATMTDLGAGKIPKKKYGLVIYDEAHNLKNSNSARHWQAQLVDAEHKIWATATPMDTPLHAAYFLAQITGKTREQIGRELGYKIVTRMYNGEEREYAELEKGATWHQVKENLKALRQRAVQAGSLVRREYPFYGKANFRNAPGLNGIAKEEQQRIIEYWDRRIERAFSPSTRRNLAGQKTLELSRWLEIQKLPHVLDAVLEDLQAGKKVVVFAEGYSDTMIKGLGKEVPGLLSSLAKELDSRGIPYLKLFEDSAAKKAKAAAGFQRGEADVILATPKSGGAGIDLDDVVGDAPRSAHFVTMNFSGDVFDQMLGRVSRRNTASPAAVYIWRQLEGFADRRRQEVLDRKLAVLRNIQAGEDLDVNRFVEEANSEAPGGAAIAPGGAAPSGAAMAPGGAGGRGYNGSEFLASDEPLTLNAQAAAKQESDAGLRWAQQKRGPLAGQGPLLNQQTQAARGARGKMFPTLRAVFAPTTIDESARAMGGILRFAMGREYEAMRQADFALRPFRKEFDTTPVQRSWQFVAGEALPRNYEVMRAIDTGEVQGLTPIERQFALEMRRLLDEAIDAVQDVSPNSLRELIENYFPRIWRDPDASHSRDLMNRLLAKRPWEGPKSFLRKRVLEYFTDGLRMGLRPVSDNPVDVTLQKLGEMYRFAATRRAMEEAKAAGLRKFFYIYEDKPPGWRKVDDPSSNVWAPPVVTIKEAFDAQMRAKALEMLKALGIPHERLAQIGGQRWGYAERGSGRIVTKFAGPDFVIWHEMGHQVDWKYPELRTLLPSQGQSVLAQELRALADLRFEGQKPSAGYQRYVRKTPEKMANLFDAYVRAPQKFQATAPNVWRVFNEWLDQHPEVKAPLDAIKPSLTLDQAQKEMRLPGPPKLGDWMMPEGAAQVVNNYLKPGLGHFQQFRTLREIMGLQNAVQLAGFFHAGFVMWDAGYSGIGLALYDVMQGKPGRALKEVAQIPFSPFVSLYRGGKIKSAIENPAAATAEYRRLAQLAVAQNLRAGHESGPQDMARRWKVAFNEWRAEKGNAGAAWDALWQAPFAGVQKLMWPVMEFLVPRMKLGIYARMAERVMADHPNASTEEIRYLLGKAADATENRLGQVTYDNLFQVRAVKDGMQLAFRAYGWQLTKYRMLAGGARDWGAYVGALAKGEKPTVTFDMTYLPAMVLGHAIIGGTIQVRADRQTAEEVAGLFVSRDGAV